MKELNIKNLTPEQIEDLRQQLKAFDGQPKTIMDKVKSWEDAGEVLKDVLFYWVDLGCKILECGDTGVPNDLQNRNLVPSEKHAKSILATSQLMVIAEALNEGWKPNWRDKKCFVGHEDNVFYTFESNTSIQNQIVFKSAELARYTISQFPDLWYDYFMIDKPS